MICTFLLSVPLLEILFYSIVFSLFMLFPFNYVNPLYMVFLKMDKKSLLLLFENLHLIILMMYILKSHQSPRRRLLVLLRVLKHANLQN